MSNLIYYCDSTDSVVKHAEWYEDNVLSGAFLIAPEMAFVIDNAELTLDSNMYTQWKNSSGGVVYEFGCNLTENRKVTTTKSALLNEFTNFNVSGVYGTYTEELAEKLAESVNNVHNWNYKQPAANIAIRTGENYTLSGNRDMLQTNSGGDKFNGTQTWGNSLKWDCFDSNTQQSSFALKLGLYMIQSDIAKGLISCSDGLKNLLDTTLESGLITTRGVHWTVNIDGVKNPNLSLTWSNEMAERLENASVELRCFSSARADFALVNPSQAFYVGRYGYNEQPVVKAFNAYYKNNGSGTDYVDTIKKFYQNYIQKAFEDVGAFIVLYFRMTYIADGTLSESAWCYAKLDYYGNAVKSGVFVGENNDGSSVTITTRNTDDVYEEFNDNLDSIDINNYGVSGISLMTKTYAMTTSRLKQLGDFLWDRDFTDRILDVNQSPIENIVSCKVFPFTINGGADTSIVLGNVNTGIMGNPITENQNFVIDIGSFKIPKKYNNWLDYTMTSVGIFLPFAGFFTIDTNQVMNKNVSIKLYIDILTGVCKYVMYVNNIPIQEFGGQIGFDIPLTSQNRTQTELSQITSFAGGVTSLASGNVMGGISGIMNGVIRPKDNFQTAGSLSPTVNLMTTHDVFIVIERPVVQYPSNYGHVYGYPCNLKFTLNNLSGYTKCVNVDVYDVPCTEQEKDMIKSYLESGVIL